MRFRWWMVWLLIGPITFVMSLDRTAIVVAAPVIQKEYGFSLVEMSLILTSFSWTYAFLQVPAGWLAERIGPRRALYWANLLWSLLTAATPLGFSVPSFIAIRTALGVGQSADWPSSVLALRRWFPKKERAKGNSVLLGGLYLGPIIAAPITTAVMLSFGWRFVFYAFGVIGILLGFAWWIVFRDDPSQHPRVSPEEAALITAEREPEPPSTPPGALPALFRSGQFWAIGVQYFFLILIQSFYTTWLPTYLVQARHFSLKSMGIFASLPWVALFCMVFIAGGIADRRLHATGSAWHARVPAAIAGFVISAGALILAAETPNIPLMVALLCISLGAIGLTQVSIWSSCQDIGGAATGIVTGWANFLGNASGFVGPVITAFLVRAFGGWSGALLTIALAGLCGAILWLFVHPERPLRISQPLVTRPA